MSDDEGLLRRWSRLKREGGDPDLADALPPEAANEPLPEPETAEEEAALLADLGLPAPESLKPGDDFSAFMQAQVPAFLRRRALRVLWRSNPALAGLDGLLDYGEDYNDLSKLAGTVQTAYEVGKGLLKQKSADATPASEVVSDAPSDAPADPAPAPSKSQYNKAENGIPTRPERPENPVSDAVEPELPAPRRMIFSEE